MRSILDAEQVYIKLKKLSQNRIVVGVPYNNDFLNMIGLVQEHGAHIRPKNGQYLVIPTAAAEGRKASEIDGLYKRGHALGVDDSTAPYGFKVMFVLRESVVIPPRPWLLDSFNHHKADWVLFYKKLVARCINDADYPFEKVYNTLGRQMVADVRQELRQFNDPPNAPLTISHKGENNPLMDTGKLYKSITWYLERKVGD
ncbi:hypothetical protein [Secundilactobacillus kimchicus]|uniref:hypothetical protein n=1 Tax=Secundilactobacillus kimchicus TaxID=528209 RepID=UPI0024A8CF7F|nr:hypothetical protein [Secundilactobacillus kimchicus]